MPAKLMSTGTSSGATGRMLVSRLRRALAAVRESARSLTSSAHTVAPGDRDARAQAMGPYPQPRSSSSPSRGGSGTALRSSMVPGSTALAENTPRSALSVKRRSGNASSTSCGCDGTDGAEEK